MTSALLINPTAMEAGLISAARARKSAGAAQHAAFDRFARMGLPHRRVEGWKWSDFRAALRKELPPAQTPSALAASPFAALDPIEIRIVDGAPEIFDCEEINGVRIYSTEPAAASEYLDDHAIVALNAAMARAALAIVVEDGASIERPILIRHIATGGTAFSQARIKLGKDANAVFIETYEIREHAFLSAVNHLSAGARANIAHYVMQTGDAESVVDGVFAIRLAAGATLEQTGVAFGGALARLETHMHYAGPGAAARLGSVALLSGRRHGDFTSRIWHASPECETRQLHRAALAGEARGVFQGKFRVERGADKTDANMTANALLLSDKAEADHKPELEIYADDVQCAHGSTVGALDEDALFYLRQRGLDEHAARALLIEAFVGEAIDGVSRENVRNVIRESVEAWLELGGAP
ncbi:MAG: Fe-S cluster assembly protein SufD [Parvularculaceae bacterium]